MLVNAFARDLIFLGFCRLRRLYGSSNGYKALVPVIFHFETFVFSSNFFFVETRSASISSIVSLF